MALKSRTALWGFLKRMQETPQGPKLGSLVSEPKKLNNEVFGGKAMIYLTWRSPQDRKAGESLLTDAGFQVQRDYWPGSATSEVRVSYFKGFHWNE